MTSDTPRVTPPPGEGSGPVAARPSILRVLKDQKKTIFVAAVLAVAAYWIAGQLGEWRLASCIAIGVGLGLLNHLATEFWLLRMISSGEQPTKGRMMAATMTRLAVLTVVAVGLAVLMWPDGIGLLLGLALFRLIALVMTSIPLLKELKQQ